MSKPLPLGPELGLLSRIRLGGVDLLQLVAQDVEVALAGALALADLRELPLDPEHLRMRLAIRPAALEVLLAGEAVERLELRAREGQLAVLVLPVEGEQARAQGLELRRGGGAAGQEGAGPATCGDTAADRYLRGALRQALGDLGQLRVVEQAIRKLEDSLHICLARPWPDDVRPGLPSHQQVEGVREDRLARPGLAGDRVQPGAEAQLGALNQEQVFDSELEEHRLPVLTKPGDGLRGGGLLRRSLGGLWRAMRNEMALAHQGENGERPGEQDQRSDQQDVVERVRERNARRMECLVVYLRRRLVRGRSATCGDAVGESTRRLRQQRVELIRDLALEHRA